MVNTLRIAKKLISFTYIYTRKGYCASWAPPPPPPLEFSGKLFRYIFLSLCKTDNKQTNHMSTTSSSSSHDGGDGGNGGGGEFEGPSHSRQRFNNAVWPEPFLEALATQIAIDAALSFGRLAVAPALTNLFQVKSHRIVVSIVLEVYISQCWCIR